MRGWTLLVAMVCSVVLFVSQVAAQGFVFSGGRTAVVSNGVNTTVVRNRGLFGNRVSVVNAGGIGSSAVVLNRRGFASVANVGSRVVVNPFAVQAVAVDPFVNQSFVFGVRRAVAFVPHSVAVVNSCVSPSVFSVRACAVPRGRTVIRQRVRIRRR